MGLRIGAALVALLVSTHALGQAITDPNQIVGGMRFTNVNPEILAFLEGGGLTGTASVSAVGPQPGTGLSHSSSHSRPDWLDGDYEVTVESGEPGHVYEVALTLKRHSQMVTYRLLPLMSEPVDPEPAPDVVLHFEDCAGLLDVTFVDQFGDPVSVSGGSIAVSPVEQPPTGPPRVQASATLPAGDAFRLAVSSEESPHAVVIQIEFGDDAFTDLLSYSAGPFEVDVACDEVVPLEVVLPWRAGGGVTTEIVGEVAVLGEELRRISQSPPVSSRTVVRAQAGELLWNNRRYDFVDREPSSGPFALVNLMPSDAVTPPEPYEVDVGCEFREGARRQWLRMPSVDVLALAGTTTDLGDTFVIDPGYLFGDVELTGPPAGSGVQGLLGHFKREENPPASEPHVTMNVRGSAVVPPGAVHDTDGGWAQVRFPVEYDAAAGIAEGDYEVALGGLDRSPGAWRRDKMRLSFSNTATPEVERSYQRAHVDVRDIPSPDVVFEPGVRARQDIDVCTSEVFLRVVSTSGTFFDPRILNSEGAAVAMTPTGELFNRALWIAAAYGTPIDIAAASDQGLVAWACPAGVYTLEPFVTSVNPGGGTSQTQLPPIELPVGCRQVIELDEYVVVQANYVPPCIDAGTLVMNGRVSAHRGVAVLTQSVDQGPPEIICTDCGTDPTYSVAVDLSSGARSVRIEAQDGQGGLGAVTVYTTAAQEPSAIDQDPSRVPLRVTKAEDGRLDVSWEPVPGGSFTLHAGSIDAFARTRGYDHAPVPDVCRQAEARAVIPSPEGGAYFLASANCTSLSGTTGRDSTGRSRPVDSAVCP